MQEASQPERRVFSYLERKLRRMTILVGMVGSDGIVLAADRRMTQNSQTEKELDDHESIRKIINLAKHRIAYARVGDYVTKEVASKFSEELDLENFDFAHWQPALKRIAATTVKEAAAKAPPYEFDFQMERSLLIVFYGNQLGESPQLWRFRISPPDPEAEPIHGIAIKGAIGNSARFFEYYFQYGMPIRRLLPLASHVVLMAGRLDWTMIEGLDIALFDSAGFHLLNESQIAPLREGSNKLDALIRERLFAESP